MPTGQPPGVVQPAALYSEQAARIIRSSILDGQYRPGDRLNEVELSTALRISRSPIREALRKLVEEGLVVLRPGRGAFVASADADELRDLVEMRFALDVLAARLAAQRATPQDIERMMRSIDSTSAAHRQRASVPPWSSDFHLLVLNASGNRKLRERGAEVHAQLHLARFRAGSAERRAGMAHSEHADIVQAIRDHEPDRAAVAMERHLNTAAAHIIRLARAGGSED